MAETASTAAFWRPSREVVDGRVYTQTDTLHHAWTDGRGRRMNVALALSYSASAERAEVAAEHVQALWPAVVEQARLVCEQYDLGTDWGPRRCEEQLCGDLTQTLFPRPKEVGAAVVERVIWKRVTWD